MPSLEEVLAPIERLRRGVIGAGMTTFAIGGGIEYLIDCSSLEELSFLVRDLCQLGLSYRVLGAGSNVLISSAGLKGPIIKLGREFRYIETVSEGRLRVGAAVGLMSLCRMTCEQGYGGLEFAGGIPGSVGGAVFMNAGAHDSQMANIVSLVRYVSPLGEIESASVKDLDFKYRSSGLPDNTIIYEVELCLKAQNRGELVRRRQEFLRERKSRQPLNLPSAGSVFKNPSRVCSAGYLIDQAGLKGTWQGGAQISALHANWIVNPGRLATHQDVLALIRRCQEEVSSRFAVHLEPEIKLWCD